MPNLLELPSPNDMWVKINPPNVLILPQLIEPKTGPLVPQGQYPGSGPVANLYPNTDPACVDGCDILIHDKATGWWFAVPSGELDFPGCNFLQRDGTVVDPATFVNGIISGDNTWGEPLGGEEGTPLTIPDLAGFGAGQIFPDWVPQVPPVWDYYTLVCSDTLFVQLTFPKKTTNPCQPCFRPDSQGKCLKAKCDTCFHCDVNADACIPTPGCIIVGPNDCGPMPFVDEGLGFYKPLKYSSRSPLPPSPTQFLDPTPRGNPAPVRGQPLSCLECDGAEEELLDMNPATTAQTNEIRINPQIGGNVGGGIPPMPNKPPTMSGIPKPSILRFD